MFAFSSGDMKYHFSQALFGVQHMELRNEYYAKMVCSRMVCQKSDEINSPSELVQVRVLRKAPYVKVGGPVRREELNSNRKLYPKIGFEHLILFKQNRFRHAAIGWLRNSLKSRNKSMARRNSLVNKTHGSEWSHECSGTCCGVN